MLVLHYPTKKALKLAVGQPLRFTETSMFGAEYCSTGTMTGCNHPKRSWFASITMKDGKIAKVE
ncbi:MAG: hypothetical protein DRH37_07795 [Deltaproteobacteria bacterium]|nr:MAG: hypothetical protein DRH37_07795 [Deltaproteobacteria bacterium]